ncbi:MAG: pseudouridine synthase [Gammaproteobacteria bacterium]|nr:pseudouridine synthase [Gammaproteobacteria bacterium]
MTTIRFNKPFRVLTQFREDGTHTTLASYIDLKKVYPAGRLDHDSEGLLLLTDDGRLQHRISDPKHKLEKRYWVQLEGEINDSAIQQLQQGVSLKDGMTKKAYCRRINEPATLWPRDPPIRQRANIPTSWIELGIKEGKNRQVRRMTAAVGFPTLRLIRYAIGSITLDGLKPGAWDEIDETELTK